MFRVKDKLVDESFEKISPIEGEGSQITISKELLDGFRTGNHIRMASSLFKNMSGLLPERLNNSVDNNRSVNSNVVTNTSTIPIPLCMLSFCSADYKGSFYRP